MIAVDIIGLFFTVLVTGIRYPHYVFFAILIHHVTQVLTVLIFKGNLSGVIAAGAFSSVVVSGLSDPYVKAIVYLSGGLAVYAASCAIGGVEFEPTSVLINPWAKLRFPCAVVFLRVAMISLVFAISSIF